MNENIELQIIDLQGDPQMITDLDTAIKVTGEYMLWRHEGNGFEDLDNQLNKYWADFNEKLIALKAQLNNTNT